MGLFDFLRRSADPTAAWTPSRPLGFDVQPARRSVNGIELGEPYHRLQAFGRPSNPHPASESRFVWRELGLAVDLEEGQIDGFEFVFEPEEDEDFAPATVDLRLDDGIRRPLSSRTGTDEVLSLLGKPQNRVRDEDGTVLYFTREDFALSLEFEFNEAGRLKRFLIYPD